MLYLGIGIFILCIGIFFVLFRYQNQRVRKAEAECRKIKQRLEMTEGTVAGVEGIREAVWEYMNTIHLYAALSEEEAKTQSLKDKQKQIRKMAEELMKKVK
jgi:hypothetical protein